MRTQASALRLGDQTRFWHNHVLHFRFFGPGDDHLCLLFFGLEKLGLRKRSESIDHFEDREFASIREHHRDLAHRRAGKRRFTRYVSVSREKRLNNLPALVEDLHEVAVVKERAYDEIPTVIMYGMSVSV